MLKNIELNSVTVFGDESIDFSRGLNVIIGENGTGKSHLLKMGYILSYVSHQWGKVANQPSKASMQKDIADKMINVFRPETLGRLTSRVRGRARSEISTHFSDNKSDFSFSFATNSKSDVTLDRQPEQFLECDAPLYIPTREVVTIFPGFVALYEGRHLEFEETYRDLCIALGQPLLKGPREKVVKKLVAPLEKCLGGRLWLDKNGRFYLSIPGKGTMEMPLVAEGIRKLAMLSYLMLNGSLSNRGTLFWDEPEANLNPQLLRVIAGTLVTLAASGIQIVLATHSLFLLRELELLTSNGKSDIRFIALSKQDGLVAVEQSDDIVAIQTIAALEAEADQNDRMQEWLEK